MLSSYQHSSRMALFTPTRLGLLHINHQEVIKIIFFIRCRIWKKPESSIKRKYLKMGRKSGELRGCVRGYYTYGFWSQAVSSSSSVVLRPFQEKLEPDVDGSPWGGAHIPQRSQVCCHRSIGMLLMKLMNIVLFVCVNKYTGLLLISIISVVNQVGSELILLE